MQENISVYGIRRWGKTRKWTGDIESGAYSVLIDVLQCNLMCAHCFVCDELLRGRKSSPILKHLLEQFPENLRQTPQSVNDVLKYAISLFRKEDGQKRAIELTGGEPTLSLPKVIAAIAEISQNYDLILGINTNGFRLSKEYLSKLHSFKETIQFLVSIRDFMNDDAFLRFTGIELKRFPRMSLDQNLYEIPFQAARRVIDSGFQHPYLGVTLDTIAEKPALVPGAIEKLFELFYTYGLNPSMVIWDIIKYSSGNGQLPNVQRMDQRGYDRKNTDAVLLAAKNHLVNVYHVKEEHIR